MPVPDRSDTIEFSRFRLDLRGGQLTRGGVGIPLRPKTWAVLVHLLERPGVLVSKDELLDAVWRDIAVTPDTLTKSIGELRVALGDDVKTPRFIETVHRRGFRFIGKLHNAAAPIAVSELSAPSPFVGRRAELARLQALFEKAAAGERQIVFVTGPAGVGKTTLVEAFLASDAVCDATSPVWVGRGGCIEQLGPREPYMPVLEATERLTRLPDRSDFAGLLRRVAPTWLAQLPWLLGDEDDELRRTLHSARAERMLREFAMLTEELTRELTLILVLEDLHWSDPSTVDVLSLLGQRREPARLLVIGTYRPAEMAVQEHGLAHVVRSLRVRRQCHELEVYDLTEHDVARYLDARFPGADIPPTLAAVIHNRTDGNPLFVDAVVAHMISHGWVLDTAPGWSFTCSPENMEWGLPEDARRIIESQFESLGPADQAVLEAASVAGKNFSTEPVAAALGCSVDEVEQRCDSLVGAHRFLCFDGVAGSYGFIHELYRTGVYSAVAEGRRRRLHRRIGEFLESQAGEHAVDIAPDLVVHFEHGGDYPRALRYLDAAASRARQRFAVREAVDYLEAALVLTARLSDADDRCRRELELRLILWPLLNDLYGYASDRLRENCERAHQLCNLVGTPQQRFHVLYALCHVYGVRADPVLAPAMAAQLDEAAERAGAPECRLLADSALSRLAFMQARYREACRIADGLAARCRASTGEPSRDLVDALTSAGSLHALALWFLGQPTRAWTVLHAAVAEANARASLYGKTVVLAHSGLLPLFCRRVAEVRAAAAQLADVASEQGFGFYAVVASMLQGWAHLQLGEIDVAVPDLEDALLALRATGSNILSTYVIAFLAEAHLRRGDVGAGLTTIAGGLIIAETTLDRTFWPELYRLKGELLVAAGGQGSPGMRRRRRREAAESSQTDAERCLIQAVDLAREMEAKSLELRAATSLARYLAGCGREVEAVQSLRAICDWFGEHSDNRDLVEARALLADLAGVSGTADPARAAKGVARRGLITARGAPRQR